MRLNYKEFLERLNTKVEDLDGEEWRQIESFPIYCVSNYGRVKRIACEMYYPERHDTMFLYEKLCKPNIKHGYEYVQLCSFGTPKNCQVHRLVATAFIPNPENKAIAHHIDGNPRNNKVDNLAWVSNRENTNAEVNKPNGTKRVNVNGKVYKSIQQAAIGENICYRELRAWLINPDTMPDKYRAMNIRYADAG